MAVASIEDRRAEVWDRLRGVIDPELDESVVDLGFVTYVDVEAGEKVRVGFRLPTYWCAANFSYLMADDMRLAIGALPWVGEVEVTIGEHMYAEKINEGLKRGLSFAEAFGDEADDDLGGLRRTFLVKAFQRRQSALLDHLIAAGFSAAQLVDMSLEELSAADLDDTGSALRRRYFERRGVVGEADARRAFVDAEGDRLQAETLAVYMRAMRRVGVNAEFNGALCRGLLRERFRLDAPEA
ncbi:MAG TPA: iron-sulfur cluster assembly protein [Bradyrhizobium sp.]|uniref:metal-sulfur cluster assembly factor n=1 Tax=Bradyrhizobium sp. TaxID=376 RepID=UPI002BA5272A|nr:iron-sulfur cluster assembly protein [Bradyrhizobium sp.]HXB77809.1 iron-sulfur cluster assembly protein [Bradyrhizobium sp.]